MEKQIIHSSQNFNTPFITDMTEICQKIKNLKINRNTTQVQNNVEQIKEAVLNVAKKLQRYRQEKKEEKQILVLFKPILDIDVGNTRFDEKGEYVVQLPDSKFNILLREKEDGMTYDLISIKKSVKIEDRETNCLVMEFKQDDCSYLKKLAFLENFNCFGNLGFTTIFNKIVVPLSEKFGCKYIYLEDQSYFYKPANKSRKRLYVDKNLSFGRQDDAFFLNNKASRKEFLLYTRMAFGFRKFETYYQNLLQCYPLYTMVFEAFKELVQEPPDSMETIREVLDTIMALNKILVEYCVQRLTVKDVNDGCKFPKEDASEKNQVVTSMPQSTIRRSPRGSVPNSFYGQEYDTGNRQNDNNASDENMDSVTVRPHKKRKIESVNGNQAVIDNLLADTDIANLTIYAFTTKLDEMVKANTTTDPYYLLADRIFRCLFIYLNNDLFPLSKQDIPDDEVFDILSDKYLKLVLKPFLRFSEHSDDDSSMDVVLGVNPSSSPTTSSSTTGESASQQVKDFVLEMFRYIQRNERDAMKQESGEKDMTTDSRQKLINKSYIIEELEKKDIRSLLEFFKTVLISWNRHSSTTVRLLS